MSIKPRENTQNAIFHIIARNKSEVDLFKDKNGRHIYPVINMGLH